MERSNPNAFIFLTRGPLPSPPAYRQGERDRVRGGNFFERGK